MLLVQVHTNIYLLELAKKLWRSLHKYCLYFYFQTVTNQAIFRVEAAVCKLFRDYLTAQGFVEIHTPKIISG